MSKILFLVALISINISYSQIINNNSSQRILIGTVTNDEGSPQNCEIEVVDKTGKKFVVNVKNGKFEQLLNAKENYTFTFVADDILRDDQVISLESPDKDFTPQKMNFKVLKLSAGKTLFSLDLFEEGTASLKSNSNEIIKRIKTVLKFNRSIKLDLVCGGDGGLSTKRVANLKTLIDSDRRLKRSVNVTTGTGTDEKTDLEVKINSVVDRMK
ncbi:hypothetical protein OAQ99_05925 [Candidatus Kapabacteria bacterium]|nr:hypothetical protein [Candidatus Kapabacteria bacterium]